MSKTRRYFEQLFNEKPIGWFWWVFFAYTALVAFFVQLVLLPYVFPQWHFGHGLLISYFDAHSAHHIASDLARKIHTEGWSVWELRANGQGQAGIAAAIYSLTLVEPWVLIPLNAALHATATFVLLLITNSLLSNRRLALLAVLPFLAYPSAMTWYTQILKDGYSIAGTLMVMYSWTLLARRREWERRKSRLYLPLLLAILGISIIWVVRPFVVGMMQMIGVVVSLLITLLIIWQGDYRKLHGVAVTFLGVLVVWTAFGAMKLFKPVGDKVALVEATSMTRSGIKEAKDNLKETTIVRESGILESVFARVSPEWTRSDWLPPFIDVKLQALSGAREGFRTGYLTAVSNIDSDIKLRSATDVIKYLPRAAQIAFLAPFPAHWLGVGSLEANTMMRRITAFEMLGVYFSLLFLPYAIWHWRKRIELWIILICCIPPLLIYGIVVANIGTLYRMRYGFLMTLVALGLAGFIAMVQQIRQRRGRLLQSIDQGKIPDRHVSFSSLLNVL